MTVNPVKVTKLSSTSESNTEVPMEILADAIVALSKGIKALLSGRLNERALILLIQHASPTIKGSKIGTKEIKAVLAGIEGLEKEYIKKSK